MKQLSLKVSPPREFVRPRTTVETGVFEEPVAARVMLRKKDREGEEWALRVRALSPGWRRSFEERLLTAEPIDGSGVRPREGRPQ